jgi:putative ABC transport system ATP-binding protein
MTEALITAQGVSHWFGSGELRKQILCDVSTTVEAGEIVILTGPSGSGKTTLLTLMGALRAAQAGSLCVLGQELRDASEATQVSVRSRIGFIFQLHNLIDALDVTQNVTMGLYGVSGLTKQAARDKAVAMLAQVGLESRARHFPHQLSGGQKQRVAIARALVGEPRIILADEPTASLDKQSGREVVDRIQALAKKQGAAVVLVTHDNRILDIADRIVHLEEGRLSGYADAVRASTQQLLGTLLKSDGVDTLTHDVDAMDQQAFAQLLDGLTAESQQMLQVMTIATDEAFQAMLERLLRAVTLKVGQLLHAERASLLLGDTARHELWSLVAEDESGKPVEIRMSADLGIAGQVYRTGIALNVPDAYQHPSFHPDIDRRSGYRTRNLLCVPLFTRERQPFAVVTLLNKQGAAAFEADDERRLTAFAASISVVLETWHAASTVRRATAHGSAAAARVAVA